MKHLILFVPFIFACISQTNAQSKKEVDNGIFITFPSDPEYKTTNSASTFVAKTDNCFFMVLIQRNAIPNYAEYVITKQKWTVTEIQKVENSFLDNAVKGKLDYTGNTGTSIKVGKFNGRQISYSAINPASGERGKRFTRLFLVRDKAISFEV